jgi:hypothetical protein
MIGTMLEGTHLPTAKLVSLIQALETDASWLQIARELGMNYKVVHRIGTKMKAENLPSLKDIMDNGCSLGLLKESVRHMLMDEPEDTEEFQAGILILTKMRWKVKSPEKLAIITGYDSEFVSEVFRNCSKNRLWGDDRIHEQEDWVDPATWEKDPQLACVGFMLHTMCAVGKIERVIDDNTYQLPKGKSV